MTALEATGIQYEPQGFAADLGMTKLAARLRELDDRKNTLEEELKTVKADLEQTDRALKEQMVLEEVSKFTFDKVTFSLNTRIFASPREGQKENLYGWLKENGFGDLVKETVHAGALSSWAKEVRDENAGELPGELQELLNVYDKTTVGMRRGK